MRVLMLNAGRNTTDHSEINRYDTLRRLRQSSKHWKVMVGERYERFGADRSASPKYRVPSYRQALAEFNQRYAIRTDNFTVYGSLTRGGLSNLWGAGVSRFDDTDLEEFPITFEDLRRSYQYVTRRIGVSGSNDDDLSDFHGREESLQPPIVPRGNGRLLYEIGVGLDRHRITGKIQAKQVVLASGTIGSARLVMDALGLYDESRASVIVQDIYFWPIRILYLIS